MVKRSKYNAGRVMREAGLGKKDLTYYSLGMDRTGSKLTNDIAYLE